jgi:hypothetical protein
MLNLPVLKIFRRDRRDPSGEAPASQFEWMARIGYAACGLVYISIGLTAGAVALGLAEDPKGSRGVMKFIARQPLGELAVIALGAGLAAYAMLNIAGAVNDPERRGVSLSGILVRAADALTGAIYIALAVAALAIVVAPEGEGVSGAVAWAEGVLALPYGATLLGLVGLALVGGSVYLSYRAWDEPFGNKLDRRSLSVDARWAISVAARVGTVVRAVIFGICGMFVIRAAAGAAPDRVADVDDALAMIGRAAFGPLLLVVVAGGFVAYGIYQLAKARYQRITDASVGAES